MIRFASVAGIALIALLSIAALVYGGGRMNVSSVSAAGHGDDEMTRAYVESAIGYYADKGLGKTVRHYGNPLSWEGGRYLIVADAHTHVLVSSPLLYLNGRGVDSLVPGAGLGDEIDKASETGHWFDSTGLNMLSGEREAARYFIKLSDGLAFMSARFGDLSAPLPDPPAAAEPDDDALTVAYVMKAIERYESEGPEAAFAYYNNRRSHEGERALFVVNEDSLLSVAPFPALVGSPLGLGRGAFPAREEITEEGIWADLIGLNPATGAQSPMRAVFILRDGFIFASGHFPALENVEAATQDYVNRAIELYQRDGLEATVGFYNSQRSLEGQLYLFLIGADDNYLAHPIFPHLIGTDIKDVVGSDGQELGREIAQATVEGIWVEYLWPHPTSRKEREKITWAIRHDGLIFASGYYLGEVAQESPPWRGVDQREYTVDYVNRAIERYERDGLEAMKTYYNSVASFEGEWYLFATDENDVYHVHPLIPRLIGTDIKDVVGSDGYELGKEIAQATEEGIWVEYPWPHPVSLKETQKVGYAVRHDGMIFASGYYPEIEDPAAYTQAYVQKAIDYYEENGLDATVAYYNSEEGIDGEWFLVLVDEDYRVLVDPIFPNLIGIDSRLESSPTGPVMRSPATESGAWHSTPWFSEKTAERLQRNLWVIRYDGLTFISSYFTERGEVGPAAEPDADALTRAYVMKAIERYEREGLDAAVAHYNSGESVEDGRSLIVLRGDDHTVLASAVYGPLVGSNSFTAPGTALGTHLSKATSDGYWITGFVLVNPATGQRGTTRFLVVRHDDLIFGSPRFIVREEYAKDYVRRAIALYEREGLDATIAFYDSQASVDGEFYLFLIGADDIYLAHPILPHLKGTDIKDVTDSRGYALGVEIAKATEDGHWVDYLWPNPVTRIEEPKSAWVVRRDGMIFASGYYTPDPNAAPPAWRDADPREYTVTYVEKAIERYDQYGLEALQSYYNSVGSFEGQWYLFATDANDIYVLHPLFSHLIGTDIKNVTDSSGFELGKEIAKATEEGHWVEYLWPHPFTLQEVPKVAYVARHKGLLFASGYYPEVEDPRAYTQQFVADAVARYKRDGREATIAYYNSPESIDGQWLLLMVNERDGAILANALTPQSVGTVIPGISELDLIEEGMWFPPYKVDNPLAPEKNTREEWAVVHDGIIFLSGYFFTE